MSLLASPTRAAVLSWSGGSGTTANWNDSGNWGFVGIPGNGDTVIFSAAQPRQLNTNNIVGLTLAQIRFVGPGGGYDIRGNAFTLTNNIEATNSAGANTIENAITLSGQDQIVDVTVSLVLSGALSGSVGLVQNGGGTLTLAGPLSNTYGGNTTVNTGTMILDKLGFPLAATAIPGNLIIGNGSGSATVINDANLEIVDSANVTINNLGLWNLNTWSETIGANLTLNGNGSIQAAGSTVTLSPNATITANPGFLENCSISGGLNIGSGTCTMTVSGGFLLGGLDITANISGSAAINIGGGGFVEFYGANTFTNALTLNSITLAINNNNSLGTTNVSTTINGTSVLEFTSSANITNQLLTLASSSTGGAITTSSATSNLWSGPITISSTAVFNMATNSWLTLAGIISGGGGVTKIGPGTLTYQGNGSNPYGGTTLITDGKLGLNVGGFTAMGGPLVVGDGSGTGNPILQNLQGLELLNVTPITINLGGLWDLNNNTDEVGPIVMSGGNISTGIGQVDVGGDIYVQSSSAASSISGRMLFYNGFRTITVDAGPAFYALNVSASVSDQGVGFKIVSGVGRPNFVQLLSSNSFTGPLILDNISVGAENPYVLGTTNSGTIVTNTGELFMYTTSITNETVTLYPGSTFTAQNNCSWYGPVVLAGDSTIKNFNVSALFDIVGPISGTGNVTSIGPAGSTNRFSGTTPNTYVGTTTVNSGNLVLNKNFAVAAIPANAIINNGAILVLASSQQTAPTADVLVNGGGIFEFSSFDTYFDTLRGAGTVDFGTGGWIYLGLNNGSSTFNGSFTGIGYAPGWTVGKTGTGTFILNGNSSYSAGVTHVVSTSGAGKFIINGSQPSISVIVDAGCTLGGSGSVGAITANGSISPGNSPGILNSGNVAFSSSGSFNVELTGPNPGTDYDQLNVTGTNNLANAALSVSAAFTKPVAIGQQFIILNNDSSDAITGTFNGLPGGSTITLGAYTFTVSYTGGDGNDVVLTLTTIPGAVASSTATSGNGDHGLDPNGCNNIYLVVTNGTGTPMTGITSVLSTTTEGVLIGQPYSSYANIPAHGIGTNLTSFQISTLPTFTCGTPIVLQLAVKTGTSSFTASYTQQSGELAVVPSRYDNSTATNIPDVGTIFSTNVVSGFSGPILKVTVSMWLTHPIDSDLSLSLISPDGVTVPLTANVGGGANFGSSCSPDANRTTFDDAAATSITAGFPPFIGTFRPQGSLANFIGGTANGNWRLQITDSFAGSVGALRCWSLFLDGVNCATGSGACDTCIPPIVDSITAASPQQTNRWFRESVVSSCASPKAWGGFGSTGSFHYNAYTFTNTFPFDACVSVELQSASAVMAALYVNSYDPTTISNNFLGDSGSSNDGTTTGVTTFSSTVPAGAKCIVVVNEVNPASGTLPYTLTVTGLPCPPPILAIAPLIPTPNVQLHWPSWAGGYNLEATPSLLPTNWTTITNEPIVVGNQYSVTNAETPVSRYYRLHKP